MNSSKIKKGLGRGLSSLIGETKIETQKNEQLSSRIMLHWTLPKPRPELDWITWLFVVEHRDTGIFDKDVVCPAIVVAAENAQVGLVPCEAIL